MVCIVELFAVVTPGLERVVEREISLLPAVERQKIVDGGVEFSGDWDTLMAANLELRTATRILFRIGEVRARDFDHLRKKAARLPWSQFLLQAQSQLRFSISVRHCRLYHTGAIEERLRAALACHVTQDSSAPEQRIWVRGEGDRFTFSLDSSGELLHRRGIRQETAKAPLRETLAAGILGLAGWRPDVPLVDPMCGAGTIVLEAALASLRRAPGLQRQFSFEHWRTHTPERWATMTAAARAREGAHVAAPICGSDRDAGAIVRAERNAARGELSAHVRLTCCDIANVELPAAKGLIVCNPPYGRRIQVPRDLSLALRRFRQSGWRVAVLGPKPWPGASAHHRLENGGVRVTLSLLAAV